MFKRSSILFFDCPVWAELLIAAALMFCTHSALPAVENKEAGSEAPKDNDYNVTPKRGWWWYEREPEKEARSEEAPQMLFSGKTGTSFSQEDLWKLDPDEFREILRSARVRAVRDPSDEKLIRQYYVIQDIARRKALAFANATLAFMQKNPEFSMAAAYPVTVPGRNAAISTEVDEIHSRIREARNHYALLFFESPGCRFCDAQARILRYFTDKYAWEIRPVNVAEEPQAAARFGIAITPTLLLIGRNTDGYAVISSGVASMADIEERLYRGVRMLEGETTAEEFTLYEYERGGLLDPKALLKKESAARRRDGTISP